MAKDVIIALDFPGESEVMSFLDLFDGEKPYVKIGMELYYALGPSVISEIKKRGHKIFLDLKLHDIPNTVKSAMAVLSRLDVDMTNLHASGENDGGGDRRTDKTGRKSSSSHRGHSAYIDIPKDARRGSSDPRADGKRSVSLREESRSMRTRRRGLLSARGGRRKGSVRRFIPHRDAGSSLRGRSVSRSGAGDYSRESEGDRLGLHRGRTPDNARGRSRCTVPPRGCGIFRINGYTKTG